MNKPIASTRSVAPTRPPTRAYVQGAISSIAVTRGMPEVSRHDVVVVISLHDKPFELQTPLSLFAGQTDVAVIRPLVTHSVRGRGGEFMYVAINLSHPAVKALQLHYADAVTWLSPARIEPLRDRLNALANGDVSVESSFDIVEELIDALLVDAPPTPPLDWRINWIIRKLDQEPETPFEALASELKISPSRLSHLFTHELGVSYRGYALWGRLRLAWELVVYQPGLSISEIARRMGFSDAAHLSRTFRTQLGVTPTQMRDPTRVEITASIERRGVRIPVISPPR